jgi:hypothetical protein
VRAPGFRRKKVRNEKIDTKKGEVFMNVSMMLNGEFKLNFNK